MPQVKPDIETFAKIKVVGVGGSGGAAVDRMVKAGIRGVDFMVMNTDVQALHHNSASHKLHIGKTITRGLGAGMDPEVGKRSAEESQNEIREMLKDADMVFVTCGLGGGTGSGASPVIAQIAKDMGALTVAVVTKPFGFEGPKRETIADGAYKELAQYVDTIITIPNDRVLQIIDKKTSMLDAFKIVDDVLQQGVKGISELITVPGLINVDFADVKTIMKDTGSALMGIGTAKGENRAVEAAQAAVSSPLLELSIDGARGILFTITGGTDLGMQEVSEAAKIITSSADEDVQVIFGAVVDESMGEDVRITVIATGFDEDAPRTMQTVLSSTTPKEEEKPTRFAARKSFYGAAAKREQERREQVVEIDIEDDEDDFEEPIVAPAPKKMPPQKRSSFVSKAVKSDISVGQASAMRSKPAPKAAPQDDEEEDLEIPAFIRKKMGL